MEGQLVLITGVTGHIGFAVLKYALEQGFRVRAAVRSQAKAETVRSNAALKALQKDDRLSFVVVSDMLAADALDGAVRDVDYIIHCASPVPFSELTTDNAYESYIKPAVDGTLGMLRSAAKEKSVKRIVITSSIIAVVPFAATGADLGLTYTADTRQPEQEGSLGPGTPTFVAYGAGKVSALNQAEAWMKNNQPHFDLIHLMPSFVLGRNDLWKSPEELQISSNAIFLRVIGACQPETGLPGLAMVINHIDDCARIHVQALDPKIEGNQSFIINNHFKPDPQWNDAKAIVEKRFPEVIKAGILSNAGSLESVNTSVDVAKTEQTFGIKHTYEDAVVSVVEQFLDMREKAGA